MEHEVKVKVSAGEVILHKPKAGQRNKAIVKADTPEGFKNTVFFIEMLPYCIKAHPWGTKPLREALEELEIEDYDKLLEGLKQFDVQADTKKKLEP